MNNSVDSLWTLNLIFWFIRVAAGACGEGMYVRSSSHSNSLRKRIIERSLNFSNVVFIVSECTQGVCVTVDECH